MASEATALYSVPEGISGGPGNAGRGGALVIVIDAGVMMPTWETGRAAMVSDRLRVRRRQLASAAVPGG